MGGMQDMAAVKYLCTSAGMGGMQDMAAVKYLCTSAGMGGMDPGGFAYDPQLMAMASTMAARRQ